MMRKKTTFGFALTCVLVGAVIAFVAGYFIAGSKVGEVTSSTDTTATSGYALLDEVEKIISENYTGELDNDELIRGICRGYIEGIGDNAVSYMTADEYSAYTKETSGVIVYKNYGKGVGYMQFSGFTDSTKTSFTDALSDFSGSSTSTVNMLIFDLRGCTTGDIEVVASLLDMLLPEGELIAGIDKDGTRSVLYTSDQSELDYDIAVLVNGETSGVAEIFASTLSAYGKAVVVGTTTAGSCAHTTSVQISNGDYVLVPDLYYVTKGQQTYSNSGVVPTTVAELSVDDQKSFNSGTLEIANDTQFLAAVKALGVNDVATTSSTSSSDTDTETESTATIGDYSSSEAEIETSSEEDDPYWDDESYWEQYASSSSDDEYYDDGYDDGYDYYDYSYDDGYYDYYDYYDEYYY